VWLQARLSTVPRQSRLRIKPSEPRASARNRYALQRQEFRGGELEALAKLSGNVELILSRSFLQMIHDDGLHWRLTRLQPQP
jgi:hypothetical protein